MSRLQLVLVALVIVGFSLLPCTAAQAGLLAYWNMDAGTGTTVADSSGNTHTATLMGTASGAGWIAGHTGAAGDNAVNFTGNGSSSVGEYVDCGTASSLSPGTGDFTISLWFKAASYDDWRYLLCYNGEDYSGTNMLFLTTKSTDGIQADAQLYTYGNGWNWVGGTGTSYFNDSTWYHIGLVRSSGTVTAYVNGVQEGNTATYTNTVGINQGLKLGAFSSTWNSLTGSLDDVAIWNQALTPTQIGQLAAGTLSPSSFAIPEPGTVVLLMSALLGLLAYAWRKRR